MQSIGGGCLCRAVRYRITAEPRARTLCHCRTCQLAAGGPSVAWIVIASNAFQFTAGTPTEFASSPGVLRTFCSRCGTSLTYQRTEEADSIDVTTVSLDDPNAFAPALEIWTSHRLAWECLNDSMKQYPESSRSET